MSAGRIAKDATIYVAGHRGLVGSAIVRCLKAAGFTNILGVTRQQLDLRDQAAVNAWFRSNQPEYVFLVAGTVGGILANSTRPAEFIYDNLMIHATVVEASRLSGAKRLLYLGSSCIYPRDCPQPIREEYLLSGRLEATNEPYAIAKISGIRLCQAYRRQYGCDFISAMPTNLYGPGDNFDLTSSHVLPAIMRKFDEARIAGAKSATIWGTGTPRREFLHVDDLADACLFLMEHYDGTTTSTSAPADLPIRELAETIRGYRRARRRDRSTRPSRKGHLKLLTSNGCTIWWRHQIELGTGSHRPTTGSAPGCGSPLFSDLRPAGFANVLNGGSTRVGSRPPSHSGAVARDTEQVHS